MALEDPIKDKALKWYYCQHPQRFVKIFNIYVRIFEDRGLSKTVFLRVFYKDLLIKDFGQRPCQEFFEILKDLCQYLSLTI